MILLTGTTTTPTNSSWRCPSLSAMIFTVIICCEGMLIFTCELPRFPSEALAPRRHQCVRVRIPPGSSRSTQGEGSRARCAFCTFAPSW